MKKSQMVISVSIAIATSLVLTGCGSSSSPAPTTSTISTPVVPAPSLSVGKVIMFSAPKSAALTQGWANAESWGNWTDGKLARMDFTLDSSMNQSLTLALNSHAFLPKTHNSLKVEVEVNSVKIANLSYPMSGKGTVTNLVVPALALQKNPGHLTLTFLIDKPASPKSFGLSADTRQLGIGLVSIELVKAI